MRLDDRGPDGADGRVLVPGGSLPVRSRAVVGLPLSLRDVPETLRRSGGNVRWLSGWDGALAQYRAKALPLVKGCGSELLCCVRQFDRAPHRVHETSLYLGSFDAPSELPVADIWTGHVFYKDRIAWLDTADGWQRHSEFSPGCTEELLALNGKAIKG
jgi:hypothetical protein